MFEKSAAVQVQMNMFGQITLTSLQCHCGVPQRISVGWKVFLGALKALIRKDVTKITVQKAGKEEMKAEKMWMKPYVRESIVRIEKDHPMS